MNFIKLDKVNRELFEGFLEDQYRAHLEQKRDSLIAEAKSSIATVHVERIGGEEVYRAYDDLLDQVQFLQQVDKELIKLCGYWDMRPGSDVEEEGSQ